jgi:hypothetical protein
VNGEALGELVFMMVILKIPVAYLCVVVYWAVRAEPRPPEPALVAVALPRPEPGPSSDPRMRPRRGLGRRPRTGPRPHGSPVRTYARRAPAVRTGAR